MGKVETRFVAKSEAGQGWRIWNRKSKRWWGQALAQYPEQLLAELNGEKRPERLVELTRQAERKQ
jgi:hypothetical protein